MDRRDDSPAVGILDHVWFFGGVGSPFQRELECGLAIGHGKGDIMHAGAVQQSVLSDRMVGCHRPGDDEADPTLGEKV